MHSEAFDSSEPSRIKKHFFFDFWWFSYWKSMHSEALDSPEPSRIPKHFFWILDGFPIGNQCIQKLLIRQNHPEDNKHFLKFWKYQGLFQQA